MKECFKIEAGQERKNVMSGERLTGPEEDGREKRTQKKSEDEVGEQSGGVFQAC